MNSDNITTERHDIIEGLLLSDAWMGKYASHRHPLLYFCQSSQHADYVQHVADLLDVSDRVKSRSRFDKRTYKYYHVTEFRTRNLSLFDEYHKRWYRNKIKIIPQDLIITPTVLLHAFLGDGNHSWQRLKYRQMSLCFDSFERQSVYNTVVSQLEKLGIECTRGRKDSRIGIRSKSCQRLLDYIGNCPIESYRYKW